MWPTKQSVSVCVTSVIQ